jgi:galactonate dehydratase
MKITAIKSVLINAQMRNWVIVQVFTDTPGLIGIGEASLEFQAQAVVGAIADIGQLIVGNDPRDIERNWQSLYRHPFFKGGVVTMSAISGIDQALWDIKAKDLGVPLYQILGGRARDRVRMYDHLGGGDSDAVYNSDNGHSFGEKMKKSISDGFTAVKILAVPQSSAMPDRKALEHAENLMGAAREAAGPEVDIMIDFHGRTSAPAAIAYAEIFAQFNPYFLEEVVSPDQIESLKLVRSKLTIPVAAGERWLSRFEFLPYLQAGLIDVAQPDVCHAGGITELRKIAALCETFGVSMAPHNPLGPVATMVNVHLGLTTSNFLIQEVMRADVPWRNEVFSGVPEIKDGYIYPPVAPGIGVEIEEIEASKHPFVSVKPVQWFHKDSSVADW